MTLTEAADALADVLEAENTALEALDFAAAGDLLARKQAAAASLATAQAGNAGNSGLSRAASRVDRAAGENRRLLQRAIAVQTRVMGVLASAAQRTQPAPRYGRHGAMTAAPRTAWALSASA